MKKTVIEKNGISLIVLIITIVIIITLAGTIILSLKRSNTINKAQEANFKTNMNSYKQQLNMYVSDEYLKTMVHSIENLNAETYEEIQKIIKGITEEQSKKIRIIKGKLLYVGSDLKEIEWAKETNVSLEVPYVKEGLILWYDGIYNGGIGIHIDNENVNKTIWKDLSDSGNNATITTSPFNKNSGWTSNGFKCHTGYTGQILSNNEISNIQSFTINLTGVFDTNKDTPNFPRIFSTNGTYTNVYEFINGLDMTIINSNSYINGYASNGINDYSNSTTINYGPIGKVYITITYDINTKTIKVYREGELIYSNVLNKISNININRIAMNFARRDTTGSYEYNAIRLYNRLLSEDEIQQNYNLDKSRFSL
ncbi:MAG: hypothetical protein PHR25_05150 [Clostridia bacterium]|nr:hypothetical protein [Clostridia bacterium]MDD4376152.1 hypothetical protein [Clostridia bacterium]